MNGRPNPQRNVTDAAAYPFLLRSTGAENRSYKTRKGMAYHRRICRKGGPNTQNDFYLLRTEKISADPKERPGQVGNSQIGIR